MRGVELRFPRRDRTEMPAVNESVASREGMNRSIVKLLQFLWPVRWNLLQQSSIDQLTPELFSVATQGRSTFGRLVCKLQYITSLCTLTLELSALRRFSSRDSFSRSEKTTERTLVTSWTRRISNLWHAIPLRSFLSLGFVEIPVLMH